MSNPLFLTANLARALEPGREYYWKRTGGWKWVDGVDRWWEIFVEISGWNGVGGYWLVERWRWNGSLENLMEQPRTLSAEASLQLEKDIEEATRERQ